MTNKWQVSIGRTSPAHYKLGDGHSEPVMNIKRSSTFGIQIPILHTLTGRGHLSTPTQHIFDAAGATVNASGAVCYLPGTRICSRSCACGKLLQEQVHLE
jgi:hypothetical protein